MTTYFLQTPVGQTLFERDQRNVLIEQNSIAALDEDSLALMWSEWENDFLYQLDNDAVSLASARDIFFRVGREIIAENEAE